MIHTEVIVEAFWQWMNIRSNIWDEESDIDVNQFNDENWNWWAETIDIENYLNDMICQLDMFPWKTKLLG